MVGTRSQKPDSSSAAGSTKRSINSVDNSGSMTIPSKKQKKETGGMKRGIDGVDGPNSSTTSPKKQKAKPQPTNTKQKAKPQPTNPKQKRGNTTRTPTARAKAPTCKTVHKVSPEELLATDFAEWDQNIGESRKQVLGVYNDDGELTDQIKKELERRTYRSTATVDQWLDCQLEQLLDRNGELLPEQEDEKPVGSPLARIGEVGEVHETEDLTSDLGDEMFEEAESVSDTYERVVDNGVDTVGKSVVGEDDVDATHDQPETTEAITEKEKAVTEDYEQSDTATITAVEKQPSSSGHAEPRTVRAIAADDSGIEEDFSEPEIDEWKTGKILEDGDDLASDLGDEEFAVKTNKCSEVWTRKIDYGRDYDQHQ